MTRPRHCTTLELFWYVAGWAICAECYSVNEANWFSATGALLLPGVLVLGPMGLAVGGRAWFWPFAVAGAIGCFAYLWVEAMNAVR